MTVNKELQTLFDYQRFCRNRKLDEVIQSKLGKNAKELNMEDLSKVNAAGGAIYNNGGAIYNNGGAIYNTSENDFSLPLPSSEQKDEPENDQRR